MGNPPLLACDSDALIQLFLTKRVVALRELKSTYGIQPTIAAEVEIELLWTPKFGTSFEHDLERSMSNGTLRLLDEAALEGSYGDSVAKAAFANIQTLGAEHYKHVQRGEAYTLAAGIILGVPALSHDKNALDVLEFNGFALPSPVLRVFDLFALCYQVGAMSETDCDSARKVLMGEKEYIPRAFKNASFLDGPKVFCPRLLDSSRQNIGAPARASTSYDRQIFVSPM